ncbi:MAG TPA: hypothetical protein VH370_18535 [Humisphaera sp.]|jgi:hypothetical protein|nr:hypothetical protein [Humisphaera sp.]
MPSTRDLDSLPEIDNLKRLMQSLAMLDAILSPDWEHRYFSFSARWSAGEQMGSMRNGEGDHYSALFNSAGCWFKGFDHESRLSPFQSKPPAIAPGMFAGMPAEFAGCLKEPAFAQDETTFCIWRRYQDDQWQRGTVDLSQDDDDPDGSAHLLHHLDGRPRTYRDWATDYYEREIPLPMVTAIYSHLPLDQRIVSGLNPEATLAQLAADIEEIGYPVRK